MDETKDVKPSEDVQLPSESSTEQQTTGEAQQTNQSGATDGQGAEAETAESGKGANQRIRELNQAKKQAEAEAKSLREKLAEITQPIGLPSTGGGQQVPQFQEGQEITPEQYQQDVIRTARAQVELAMAQERAANRIDREANEVLQKYPQLDPKSDSFDKELSDSITEATEHALRVNPYSASVSKIVDKLMRPYQRAVAKEAGQVAENVAKQVSETALRPTSVRQPEKKASEKSIAELEQELGIVHS